MMYFGVTSRNALKAIQYVNSPEVGLTVSTNQVGMNSGYAGVPIAELPKDIYKYRDHCTAECQDLPKEGSYFEGIHLDVFKEGCTTLDEVIDRIKLKISCCNSKVEIGTEESVFPYPNLDFFERLAAEFMFNSRVEYIVVQGGEFVDCLKNIGDYRDDLAEQCEIAENFGLKSKAHNCDFLSDDSLRLRLSSGVTSFNFGPQLAVLENRYNLSKLSNEEKEGLLKKIHSSLNAKRWFKTCTPSNEDILLMNLHYVYAPEDDGAVNLLAAEIGRLLKILT